MHFVHRPHHVALDRVARQPVAFGERGLPDAVQAVLQEDLARAFGQALQGAVDGLDRLSVHQRLGRVGRLVAAGSVGLVLPTVRALRPSQMVDREMVRDREQISPRLRRRRAVASPFREAQPGVVGQVARVVGIARAVREEAHQLPIVRAEGAVERRAGRQRRVGHR